MYTGTTLTAGEAAHKSRRKLTKLRGIAAQAGDTGSGLVVDVDLMDEPALEPLPCASSQQAASSTAAAPTGAQRCTACVCH